MFRNAWKAGRRCILPVTAYYEWKKEGKAKQPYAIGKADGRPLALGGLWESKIRADGSILRTFTVITTPAAPKMRDLHERMPVILDEDSWADWLGEPEATGMHLKELLLLPHSINDLRIWPVSTAVGNVRNNGPELLEAMG